MLDVGDGHRVYWETCGNPDGKPVLVLHGGPGYGCSDGMRRFFDPARYRIVLVDQRGCGRSTPHAGDAVEALAANTTQHLMGDLELLRRSLGIERWQLFGGSWGCVLGLAYAERVTEIVMMGLGTDRQIEIDQLTAGLGGMFPEAFERFRGGVPEGERDGDLAGAYLRLLVDADPVVSEAAARGWCAWEEAMLPGVPASPKFEETRFRLGFARLVTHYFSQGYFLEDGSILRDAGRLAGIPVVLVQGVLDLGNLVGTPWLLERAIPGAELILVGGAGHTTAAASMEDALVGATDRFAS